MYVCLCFGVTDKKIREMVRSGASCVKEIQEQTNAGANCGSCLCSILSIVSEDRESEKTEDDSGAGQQTVGGGRS